MNKLEAILAGESSLAEASGPDALFGGDGPDAAWTLQPAAFEDLNAAKFQSNHSPALFSAQALRNSGGKFFIPAQRVYRHQDLRMSPVIKAVTIFPEWMYIHDRKGRLATELLPRLEPQSFRPYEYAAPKKRPGTYLYLGHLILHFGHLLTELLSRTWLDASLLPPGTRLLMHRRRGSLATWEDKDFHGTILARRILKTAGLGEMELEFVEEDSIYERVFTPSPLNVYTIGARPEFSQVADRLAAEMTLPVPSMNQKIGAKIFYSRSKLPPERRKYYNAKDVNAVFEAHGFMIVHPQELSLEEQISLARHASLIAGEEGSAFCGALFSRNSAIFYLESGRFHTNLPSLLYQVSRRFFYMLPVDRTSPVPISHLYSMLYADPHALDRQLAIMLKPSARKPDVRTSPEMIKLFQQAFAGSLSGDVETSLNALADIFKLAPYDLEPDIITHLVKNLRQAGTPPDQVDVFSEVSKKLISALAFVRRK